MMQKAAKVALIKTVILLAIVLAFLAAINFAVSMQISSAEEDLAKMNAQVMQVKSKLSEIKIEQKVREEANRFYANYEISDSAEPENFTRDKARANIASMRKRFGLNSIQLSNTGFKEVKTDLATARSIALASYATIRFTAAYDVPIYDMVASVEDTLPGIVSVSSVKIKRIGSANDMVMESITKGNEVNLISGEISFNWFGVVDPTLIQQQPLELSDEDHEQNLKNIFDAISEVSGNLNKVTLSDKNKPAENTAPKPAMTKLMPVQGVQPAKQFGAAKKPEAAKENKPAATPATPSAKSAAQPVTSANPQKPVQKLQGIQPRNSIPGIPPKPPLPDLKLEKKGGGNAN